MKPDVHVPISDVLDCMTYIIRPTRITFIIRPSFSKILSNRATSVLPREYKFVLENADLFHHILHGFTTRRISACYNFGRHLNYKSTYSRMLAAAACACSFLCRFTTICGARSCLLIISSEPNFKQRLKRYYKSYHYFIS